MNAPKARVLNYFQVAESLKVPFDNEVTELN